MFPFVYFLVVIMIILSSSIQYTHHSVTASLHRDLERAYANRDIFNLFLCVHHVYKSKMIEDGIAGNFGGRRRRFTVPQATKNFGSLSAPPPSLATVLSCRPLFFSIW